MSVQDPDTELLACLRQLEDSLAEKDAQINYATARAVEAERRAMAIEAATFWKATHPLRTMTTRWPQAIRRAIVNGAELAWLSLTLRLPSKLRQRPAPLRAHPISRPEIQYHPRLPVRSNQHSNTILLTYLRQLEDTIAEKDAQIHAIARSEAERWAEVMETATFWRVTYPLRRMTTKWPQALRRTMVNGAELAWWSLTLRLPSKLRQRRLRGRAAKLSGKQKHLAHPECAKGQDPVPRDVLRGWRGVLDAATSRHKEPHSYGQGVLPSQAIDANSLMAKLNLLAIGSGLIISISHDDYATSCGGVQIIVNDEQEVFNKDGWTYLHVSPSLHRQTLADEASYSPKFLVNLRVDGISWGSARLTDLTTAVDALSLQNKKIECIIHHLMDFPPELLLDLLRATRSATPIVWVHDLFTTCESYTLLRNDISFCGGPEVNSMACNICCYGKDRLRHYQRITAFFKATHPLVLAPSQSALSLWRDVTRLPHSKSTVVPPARLIMTDEVCGPSGSRLRVAHAGGRYFHKGWTVFEELALHAADDDRYEFFQLGLPNGSSGLPSSIHHINVQVTPGNPNAMIEALASAKIDVVVVWPQWPETFCYVVHEALAAGAFVIAREAAGNIWPAIHASAPQQGCAVANQAELFALFEGDELIRRVANSTRRRGMLLSSGGTAGWLHHAQPPLKSSDHARKSRSARA
jgi:hypothetical protein